MSEEKKDDGPSRIMVFLRIRPAKKGELNEAEGIGYLMDIQADKKTVLLEGGKQYNFDWVFDGMGDGGQEQVEVFGKIAVPVIDNVFRGFWGSMMCYGQTGTGKSFTMCNFSPTVPGIIPRTMKYMFEKIENDHERKYTIIFSFIQIYLDKLQDLFNPEGPELKINRDNQGVNFPAIVEHTVNSEEHFRELYEDGHQHRVITATKMNPESSRGHASLFIQIKSVPRDDPSGEVRNGKLFLIDLAGYERFSKTGVQEGLMKEEAKTINASLLSLGNVVQALAEKSEHIPWRNAKLTRMLEDAVGGKAKCSIILTAGPSNEHVHETLGTLYFGFRAMSVKTNAKLAVNVDYKKLAAKLQEMLAAAEGKIVGLELEATKRQLEREQAEARMQAEWGGLKKRQEDQLQRLLTEGANPEKIRALIDANQAESDLLEEQHYQERAVLEEQHEADIKASVEAEKEKMQDMTESTSAGLSNDIHKLQRELQFEREEKERYKKEAQEAAQEAKQLMIELNELKMNQELDLGGVAAPASPGGAAAPSGKHVPVSNAEMKKELERRVENIRSMLEENFQLKMAKNEEILRSDLSNYKELYENLKASHEEQLQFVKDSLTAAHEKELAHVRQTSLDVQEKLKKNHKTIKESHLKQKQELQEENDQYLKQIIDLTRQLEDAKEQQGAFGGAAPPPSAPSQRTGPSLAEVMIMKKQAEKKCSELNGVIQDLKTEIEYITTEKDGIMLQLKEYEPKEGEERMKPAAIRQLKQDHEKLKGEVKKMETELFKLRAAQALSGPQPVASAGPSLEEDEAEDEMKEDLHGDYEGLKSWRDKLLRYPYFSGAQPIPNSHKQIAETLTTDLDEYRRMLKYKFILLGGPGSGKTSVTKCLLAGSVPFVRNLPEVVTPTLHPNISSGYVDDQYVSKQDWHKMYILCQDVIREEAKSGGLLGGLAGVIGLGAERKGVPDPAKTHVDIIDPPGSPAFWGCMPSAFLPGKNVVYCVCYDLTQPVDVARCEIERQLALIHASAYRNYPKQLGGDAPRVGFCLIGTRRDGMRERSDAAVVSHLNSITLALGETFFRLRGEDATGLMCVGNFACSCKDWTVTSIKGGRGPQSFRDLLQYLGTIATMLDSNKPSNFLPSSKESASYLTYMLGDEVIEGPLERVSELDSAQQRFRKGIVTLITGLFREQKVRWIIAQSELRQLVAAHLDLEGETKVNINAINYVIRELLVRGALISLPQVLFEPKYLPKPPDETVPPDAPHHQRDGIIALDPMRIFMMYSMFVAPTYFAALPEKLPALQDKTATLFDYKALKKLPPAWSRGYLPTEFGNAVFPRLLPLTCSDLKLLYEFFCVFGFAIGIRTEVAIFSPAHFASAMPPCVTEYLPYLVSNHGDGYGRKYSLNAAPRAWFSRLQIKLLPFSHAPTKDERYHKFNWNDASFLTLEKNRLKWTVLGSKVVKNAVVDAQLPIRGIMKLEGCNLFIAVTARGPTQAVMQAACQTVLDAIHYEIKSLCRREFRGVSASYQEMVIAGCEEKRKKLPEGIGAILSQFGAAPDEINAQRQIIGIMSDPRGQEIDNALHELPQYLFEE